MATEQESGKFTVRISRTVNEEIAGVKREVLSFVTVMNVELDDLKPFIEAVEFEGWTVDEVLMWS